MYKLCLFTFADFLYKDFFFLNQTPTSLSVFTLKKTTEWATLDLCLSSHKELLQDGGIRMLVLQLPSGSLGGQKPYIRRWFSKVCESRLCATPCVLVLQDVDLWTLVVSTILLPGTALLGHRLPQLIPHTCAREHPSCNSHEVSSFPFHLLGVPEFPPVSPMLAFTSFTMSFVKYLYLFHHFVRFYRFPRDGIFKAFFVKQPKL